MTRRSIAIAALVLFSAVGASAQPPAPLSPAGPPPGDGSAGDGSRIYIWKEKGTVHAVSNPSDVPPRYSRRDDSPTADPRIIRMLPEAAPPAAVPEKKSRQRKQSRRAVGPAPKPAAGRTAGKPSITPAR